MPTITQTVETELILTPEQTLQLRREFQLYESLKAELDDTTRDLAVAKSILVGLRTELGVKSIGLDGYRTTLVDGGTTRTLNKKRLMTTYGITPKQLSAMYDERPKKSHELVTLPGDDKKPAHTAAPRDERDVEDSDE